MCNVSYLRVVRVQSFEIRIWKLRHLDQLRAADLADVLAVQTGRFRHGRFPRDDKLPGRLGLHCAI